MQPQADWAIAQSVSNDLQDEQEQAQQDHDDKVQT
jgi:hypothetical protein